MVVSTLDNLRITNNTAKANIPGQMVNNMTVTMLMEFGKEREFLPIQLGK